MALIFVENSAKLSVHMAKFGEHHCPDCGEKQWSIADNRYVELFKTCWGCDRKRWMAKELSTEEFERKEEQAVKSAAALI